MNRISIGLLFSILFSIQVLAADWPMFLYDASRSGCTPEELPHNLDLRWTYSACHAPQPAWQAPDTRMPFDYAYHAVISDGKLYFGSSADCKVYCLDAATGEEMWHVFTDAPVRFAPLALNDRIIVVSDDGCFYCLHPDNGSILWKKRGGPRAEMILGNDRMISRWPARGAPVFRDGLLYIAAGIWPSEGIYIYALDPKDGKVVWCNDSSGSIEMPQPHATAYAKSGVSAQGFLVAAEDSLLVPTGRAVPAGFDRSSGDFQYFHLQYFQKRGGSRVLAGSSYFVNCGWVFDIKTGEGIDHFPGEQIAGFPGGFLYSSGNTVTAAQIKTISTHDRKGQETERDTVIPLWSGEVPHPISSLIVAGDTVIAGGQGGVSFLDLKSGSLEGSKEMKGIAYGLAVADKRLYVSTDDGKIHCFAEGSGKKPLTISPETDASPYPKNSVYAEAAKEIIAKTGITEGYCVDLGCGDGRLAYELAQRTNLQIYAIDSDPRNVELARQRLDSAGLYGVRVTVHLGDPRKTDYPDYFADLVVSGRSITEGESILADEEALRLQRPCGGVRCLGKPENMTQRVRPALSGVGRWTHQYCDPGNTACSGDQRVKAPLKMLWFRDADQSMPQRHGRGHAPLYFNGRIFVEGLDSLRAVDAYNGRTQWEVPFPHIQDPYDQEHLMGTSGTHSNFCIDENSVFVHTKDRCVRLDAATGETLRTYPTPRNPDASRGTWGYIACANDTLFGSLADTTHIVTWCYREGHMDQLYTESTAVFALDVDTGEQKWFYPASTSIRHNSIAIGDGKLFFIDRPKADFDRLERAKRRGETEVQPLGQLVALDAATGEVLWTLDEDIYGTLLIYSEKYDVLLMCYQDTRFKLPSEVGGRMTLLRPSDGNILWELDDLSYQSRPVVNDRTIYVQPHAIDLLTGEKLDYELTRSYGCGILSGSPNLLLFRSATLGYRDLLTGGETENYGGIRPGCWINALPVGGLVVMPNATTGCRCSYLITASIALEPAK